MHDPSTVIGVLSVPWDYLWHRGRDAWKRGHLVTLWHEDPGGRGNDDSCDWFWRVLTPEEERAALNLRDNEYDNIRSYLPADPWDSHTVMTAQWRAARRFYAPRPWYRHPKWHIHHWRLQVHPWQALMRFLFTRCATCGGRFAYGASGVSTSWHGTGPALFRGERGLSHMECAGMSVTASAAA